MTYEGSEKMLEGDFADMCDDKFPRRMKGGKLRKFCNFWFIKLLESPQLIKKVIYTLLLLIAFGNGFFFTQLHKLEGSNTNLIFKLRICWPLNVWIQTWWMLNKGCCATQTPNKQQKGNGRTWDLKGFPHIGGKTQISWWKLCCLTYFEDPKSKLTQL